jgi:DNA repair exonuclease SbcCD ATPase subunit
MKLRALELEQFRKFDRAVRLTGFGDRVNVLSGPNEFGKSTILAAIRGLLFERHNSSAAAIKAMQTKPGNAAPRVSMDFEIAGGVWRIEKRFLSKPMARLTGPDGSRFDNDAAEEELQRLLGFGAAGKQGAKPDMMGMWGALWVTQRDSVLQADLSSDLARSTITSCLDAEVGVLTGTEMGQALIRAVREQRGQFLDGNGKPRGRYKDVAAALEAVTALLAELEARAQRLSQDATELRAASEKLARESDPAAEQRDEAALAEARRRREASMLHAAQLERAQLAADIAQRGVNDAQREQAARLDRASRLAASDAAWQAGQARLLAARAAEQAADAAYAQCRGEAEAAQLLFLAAGAASRRARALADLVRRVASMEQQRVALDKASAAQDACSSHAARLASLQVTPDRLEAIRKTARDVETAQSLLQAQATHIHIDLEPGGIGRLAVRGNAVAEAASSFAAVDET